MLDGAARTHPFSVSLPGLRSRKCSRLTSCPVGFNKAVILETDLDLGLKSVTAMALAAQLFRSAR